MLFAQDMPLWGLAVAVVICLVVMGICAKVLERCCGEDELEHQCDYSEEDLPDPDEQDEQDRLDGVPVSPWRE